MSYATIDMLHTIGLNLNRSFKYNNIYNHEFNSLAFTVEIIINKIFYTFIWFHTAENILMGSIEIFALSKYLGFGRQLPNGKYVPRKTLIK